MFASRSSAQHDVPPLPAARDDETPLARFPSRSAFEVARAFDLEPVHFKHDIAGTQAHALRTRAVRDIGDHRRLQTISFAGLG